MKLRLFMNFAKEESGRTFVRSTVAHCVGSSSDQDKGC